MNLYNDEYYIVDEKYNEETLYLTAFQKTANRNYTYTKLEIGQEPLFFENAYKDEDRESGIKKKIKSVHMNGNFLIISNELRDKIKHIESNGIQLYPAVIVDGNGVYHEDYWFVNVYAKQNYINFEESEVKRYKPDNDRHRVKKYSLSVEVMSKISENNRLMFKPNNTDLGFMFFHKKMVDIFNSAGVDNLKFYKVSEWEKGMQFSE